MNMICTYSEVKIAKVLKERAVVCSTCSSETKGTALSLNIRDGDYLDQGHSGRQHVNVTPLLRHTNRLCHLSVPNKLLLNLPWEN